jgi:cytoskeleton protein RodZ
MTDELVIDVVKLAPNEITPSENKSSEIAPLGEVLLAARIAQNLTQKDASNNLRLSIKQIDALETNTFSLLPDAMITRGFIRNYARFLALDAEPLLLSYRARMPDTSPNMLSVQTSMNQVMSTKESQPWLKYILGSILVMLFLLTWFFYMDYMPKPVKQANTFATDATASVATSAPIVLPEIALPEAERTPETVNVDLPSQTKALATDVVIEAVTPETHVVSQPVSPSASKTSTPVAPQLPAIKINDVSNKAALTFPANNAINTAPLTATKNISLSCTEQTWVSITNKSGKVIYEKILSAGSSDTFDGEPPFNVVIGNAKASKLMYSGKVIDLNPSTGTNVARITLQ